MIPSATTMTRWTSRFATTPAELELVLALRRAVFRNGLVSPDETYRVCWRRNRYSMKLVFDQGGRPLGYWSVIPVSREAFTSFRAGRETHAHMLTERCLSWHMADPCGVFLYVVGVVGPPAGAGSHRLRGYTLDRVSSAILLDAFHFGVDLADRVRVTGLCGFPSRTEGFRILSRAMHLEPSNVHIDGKPVFACGGPGLREVRQRLISRLHLLRGLVPDWEEGDRDAFFAQLREPSRSATA